MDEPLSAVDPNRRGELRSLISRIQRDRAVTTIYVTHDRTEAAELGDRVALLIEGRIVQHATPKELFARPTSIVAARFFGASNILDGTVRDGWFHHPAGRLPTTAPDGPAVVTVRPERLRLGTGRAPEQRRTGEPGLCGRCLANTFQGTHRQLLVDAAGHHLEAHVDPAVAVHVGDPVCLHADAQHVWVLPDEDISTPNAATRQVP